MSRYHGALAGSPAEPYLAGRGLDEIAPFHLGYVADPLPGHEQYRGMLAIPYIRYNGRTGSVATMRFRCIRDGCEHHGHGKYNSAHGDHPRLYNTVAFLDNEDRIGVCEGEIDAITASVAGVPTVGVQGADAWQPHFAEPFKGYETVFVFADGDDAGRKFARSVAKSIDTDTRIVQFDQGEDVNSFCLKYGQAAVESRVHGTQ